MNRRLLKRGDGWVQKGRPVLAIVYGAVAVVFLGLAALAVHHLLQAVAGGDWWNAVLAVLGLLVCLLHATLYTVDAVDEVRRL
jgi:hypothetical protein